jgi:hypothetical protein
MRCENAAQREGELLQERKREWPLLKLFYLMYVDWSMANIEVHRRKYCSRRIAYIM